MLPLTSYNLSRMAARVAFTPKKEDEVDEDDGRDVKAASSAVLNSTSSW